MQVWSSNESIVGLWFALYTCTQQDHVRCFLGVNQEREPRQPSGRSEQREME